MPTWFTLSWCWSCGTSCTWTRYESKGTGLEMKRILVVIVAGLGDFVMATKALRALRNGYPHSRLHLLTSSAAYLPAKNLEYLDAAWSFPIREMRERKLTIFKSLEIIRKLRTLAFDMVVNLHPATSYMGALRMGLMFLALGSKVRVGQDGRGFGRFLTRKASAETFGKEHMVDTMLRIALLAGGIADDGGMELRWDSAAEETLGFLFGRTAAEGREIRIGIHAGGDRPNRRWPAERYAVVADRLAELLASRVFLLGGPGEEKLARVVEANMRGKAVNLAGKLNVNELCYVIGNLDVLITNDSGPMHIAAAVGTPVVALFGPGDPVMFGPYAPAEKAAVITRNPPCRPCDLDSCNDLRCLLEIRPEEVVAAATGLLNRGRSSRPGA